MSEPLTDDELSAIGVRTGALLHSGRGMTQESVALLNSDIPRLVAEFRERQRALEIASKAIIELKAHLAARDAQIARLRQIVDGAEVAT